MSCGEAAYDGYLGIEGQTSRSACDGKRANDRGSWWEIRMVKLLLTWAFP